MKRLQGPFSCHSDGELRIPISPDWTLLLRTIYTQSRGGGPRPMPEKQLPQLLPLIVSALAAIISLIRVAIAWYAKK